MTIWLGVLIFVISALAFPKVFSYLFLIMALSVTGLGFMIIATLFGWVSP